MEAPSRVLIVATHFWPSIGGVETIAEFLGNYLVRTGYQVDVATLYRQDRSFNVYRGINIISLDTSRKFNDTPLWVIQLRQLVTSGQYGACILIADPLNPIIWSLHHANIPSNTKIIIQPIINRDGYAKWCNNKIFRRNLADILKKAHAVVALTHHGVERQYFKEEGISSVLIPNAVDVIVPTMDFRAKFNISKKLFVILHIANLWPVKNHLGILDALRSMPPDWRLVMIGHPSQDQNYVSQVQESIRRNPQVVYIPGLPGEGVAAALEAADVVVLASHGEVSPVTILEAMSHKKLWIATPECGAVHDLAGGVIAPLSDFRKILGFLANSEYLQKLGSVGYEHWQACYCWPTVILAWDELIQTGSTQKTFSMPESVKQKQKTLQAQIIEKLNKPTSSDTTVTHKPGSPVRRVSIIVPTYNRPDFLTKALESIAAQSYKDCEIIVVNDAGGDVSDIVNSFQGRLAVTYLAHTENKGLAASRNTGINAASGKYIAYLDDDDVYYPDHIETLVNFLENNDYKVAYTDAYRAYQEKENGEYVTKKREVSYSYDFEYDYILVNNFIPVLCLMHEKECLDETGLFDESLMALEDMDCWIRMSRKYKFAHIKKITCEFTWREDGTSITSGKKPEFLKAIQTIYDKYREYALNKPHVLKAQDELLSNRKLGIALMENTGRYNKALCEKRQLCTIIILTWNALEYTKKCVHSIQNHTNYPHEIVFVDNASTDGSVEYLRNLVKEHSNYKLIENKENMGFAAGNNQGVAAASGECVLLLNNDVLVSDGWLESLIESLEKDEKIGMVGPITNSISGRQMVSSIPYTDDAGFYGFSQKIRKACCGRLTPRYRIAGFAVLLKKSLYEEVGGLDESFGTGNYEDDDLCLKIREKGYAIMVDEGVFIHHYRSQTFIENKIDYRSSLSLNESRFKKKWPTVDYEEMLELHGSLVDANAALIAQGQQAYDAGNINQSLDLYTKVLNTNPVDEAALCGIGQVYQAIEEVDKAICVYEKVVRINSCFNSYSSMDTSFRLLDAYSNLALLYAHADQTDKAISMLKSAIVLNGADASLYNNLGVLYFKKGVGHDARDCFEKALSIDAGYKEAQQNLEKVIKNNNASKSSEIKVSAIVSVYAAEVFMQGCLEDLTAQSLYKKGEMEIVVINSCSPQNEEKIVHAFQKNYSHIKYLRTDTRETIYQAWNRGIKIASGKYITNANADDRHRQDALELLANHLDENPNVVLVYGDQIITETENEDFSHYSPVGVFQWPEFDRNYLLKVCCTGSQPMWRKSVHSEYGFFDETLQIAGDYEFWLRISQKYCFKHVPEYLGLYLRSPQSAEYRNRKLTLHETFIVQEKYKNIRDASETSIIKTPLVSVIIPTNNRPNTLRDALNSIAAQTHKHIEVIVVNDAGEDVSAIINAFKGRLNIKYLIHDTNKDRAAARNTALKHASGQYIAYLDDDDVFYPDHIETALKVLTTTDYNVVYTDACRAYQIKAGNSYQTIKKDVPYSTDYTKGVFYKTNITPILCVVHDRACIEGVGMFDESLPVLEDWDLWIRMAEKYDFYHIKKVTCEFSWREDGSSTTSNKAGEFARVRRLIYERYSKQVQALTAQQKIASIIMLTWNALEYTKKCVNSIQHHTSYPHEIIFVDNASTDGTVEYLRNLMKEHSNYKLIENKENRGFAAGNNQGVAVASGEYVCLLNNDVLVSDGWLESLIESLEKDEKIGMVGPITNSISGRQMVSSIPYTDDVGFHVFSQKIRKACHGRLTPRYRIAGFALLMKKSLYEEVGGLDESFGTGNYEDDDLCLKIRAKGCAVMVDESVFIHHYRSQTFIENKIDYRSSLSVNESKFMKKWPDVDYKSLLELDKSLVDINADLVSQGQKAIESENADEAINVYTKVLSTNPIDEAALCGIGMACQMVGKTDGAIDAYKKVIKKYTYFSRQLPPGGDSYLLDAYRNLALVYAGTNQIDDAIFILKKAIELSSSDASLLNNLGVLYFKKKMHTEAAQCFSDALSIDAHYGEAKKNLEKVLRG